MSVKLKKKADIIGEEIKGQLIELSDQIYAHPELGHEEFAACKLHTELLERHGFRVERAYAGLKTAFRGEFDSKKPGPVIAYMAEYDALPDIGHGCGHNILGAVSTGAGIILSKMIGDIGGKVIVFGTPAEETSGGKVTFCEKGAFDDVDAAMMAHPSISYTKSGDSLAIEAIQFAFRGKTSHAASAPEKGVNALDAVINTFNNVNALRQQVRFDARIHGIVKEGGSAANVIPDYCVAQFYVRAKTKAYLTELVEKVKNCARGAALAAGTEIEISNYELGYDNLVTNQKLMETFTENLLQYVDHINEPRESLGSVDAGNVSHVCPTIHPYFSIATDRNITGHSRAFAAATKTPYAYDNMVITAKTLALTGAAIIQKPELLKAIKDEFQRVQK